MFRNHECGQEQEDNTLRGLRRDQYQVNIFGISAMSYVGHVWLGAGLGLRRNQL